MALIRHPAGTQISGSVGGVTYSHGRAGPITRARSIPVNPNSVRQQLAKSVAAALSIAWSVDLTELQRSSWNAWAFAFPWSNKLGESSPMTDINAFVRANSARMQAGLGRIDDPPVIIESAEPLAGISASGDASTQLISISYGSGQGWAGEVGGYVLVYEGLPQNPGRSFFKGPFQLAEKIAGAVVPPASPQTVPATFPLVEGQKVWAKVVVTRADGRVAVAQTYPFLVTA